MNTKQIERRSLTVSALVNGLTGLIGLAVYIMTDLNALFLDSVFSIIAFLSILVAFFISKNSHRKTPTFPQGLYFLEPLYAIMKSLATLLLLVFAVLETAATAFAYFVNGIGHPMVTGPVMPYTLSMFVVCLSLHLYNVHMNKKINNLSTIIEAEAKGNLVDALISAAIGVAMLLLYLIPIESSLGFLHYTGDFFLTTSLALISFGEPWAVLVKSFKELANGIVHLPELHDTIYQLLEQHLEDEAQDVEIRIFKQGMRIRVKIYLHQVDQDTMSTLLAQKSQLIHHLRRTHEHLSLEYAF